MLWPALQALSIGELSEDQVTWLRERFGLTDGPRTEPPGAEDSLAHRRLTDPGSDAVEWRPLGLCSDAPREVKEVKLRALTRTPGWSQASAQLRREAQEFLDDH